MNRHTDQSIAGFTILEALIAMVVVGVGAAGVAMLNTMLLQGTGESKARSEAVQIAQDRVEAARNFDLQAACDDLAIATTVETPFQGINALFTVRTALVDDDAGNDPWRNIQVCVTWGDGTCEGPDNRIILTSVVGCEGMGTSAQVQGDAGQGIGGFVRTPSGRAEVGGDHHEALPFDAAPNTIPGIELEDGTYEYLRKDGTRELLDADGKVLLTVRKLACEDEQAPEFSTISGKVFVDAKNGSPIGADEHLFVLSSDASLCTRLDYNADWVLPADASGNGVDYFYTYYQCYLGAEWWGNVGVVRTDNANTNDRVCVGNPLSDNIATLFSKHAQRSTTRGYRGYRDLGDDKFETQGIGEAAVDLNEACSSPNRPVYVYTPTHFENHHFVHANITGQGTCASVMTEINSLDAEDSLDQTGTASPLLTQIMDGETVLERTLQAQNNPGKFYCMSADDGIDCVNLAEPPDDRQTVVHGTITKHGTAGLLVGAEGILADAACTTAAVNDNDDNTYGTYGYECNVDWTGFTGESWTGVIGFAPSNDSTTLCAAGSTVTVIPEGTDVAVTINDRFASADPNSLYFTDIPNSVTSVQVDFDIKEDSCGQLGQPLVTCTTSPRRFTWQSLGDNVEYKVRICTGATSGGACTPSAVETQTAETSYQSTGDITVSNNDTFCLDVIATDIDGVIAESIPSARKCISRSGGTYTCLAP